MNYPNGKKNNKITSISKRKKDPDFSNRGMTLEEDINDTNKYYLSRDIAVVHKKPTPVQIVKVDYPKRSAAVIKEGYFKQASTTDYNGLYRGKYIDFEAKETKNKTSFPLSNFHEHQVEHMKSIVAHSGIAFILIRFHCYDQTFFFPATKLFPYWESQSNGGRKSIPYQVIQEQGLEIPIQYPVKIDYLSIIDQLYF
ncbi:recombination protein U [Natronobacillus azotifigens]|uniref:Holliday junction resolvase RecU n=1 Tax=Natronobacillus azotifigens TaxID=472978 RepID=A0A9J6R8A5_9BACI|nr:Holliday junction resolvase RecU [Natronobacillus azotifigens]MCZ0701890.1 Holliday junction resolvase RecU [Natronobacillus azotifigens]